MKKYAMMLGVVSVALALGWIGTAMGAGEGEAAKKEAGAEKKEAVCVTVFACPDCHVLAMKAGKCAKCQKDMKQTHLLGTKDGQALLCACDPGCKCDPKGMKDGKCPCGKDVLKASAKGMYVCAMGCPELSEKPGKCACGMELKKVE